MTSCTDLSGDPSNRRASAVFLELLVMYQPGTVQRMIDAEETTTKISYSDLVRRLPKLYRQLREANGMEKEPSERAAGVTMMEQALINNDLAQRYQTIINRTRL